MNFKELDCYRDKFKNIKVSFMPITKKAEKTMNSYSKEAPAINSSIRKMNATERGQESHYIRHLTTESRVNFRGENNKIVSEIKHKNLYGLKYAYRSTVKVWDYFNFIFFYLYLFASSRKKAIAILYGLIPLGSGMQLNH